MNRRHFLKLLGLGGAGVATGGVSHLFSSSERAAVHNGTKKLGVMTQVSQELLEEPGEFAQWLDRTARQGTENMRPETRRQLEGLHPVGPWVWHTPPEIRKLRDSKGHFLWQPGIRVNDPDLVVGRPFVADYTSQVRVEDIGGKRLWTFIGIQEWGV